MTYYLKGRVNSPFYIVSGTKVVSSSLQFEDLTTANPGKFVFNNGVLSLAGAALGYDSNGVLSLSGSSATTQFNFINQDSTLQGLQGLYAGVNYLLQAGGVQLHFLQEPGLSLRLVPLQWYIRRACMLVVNSEVLIYESNFINGLSVPEGTTEFPDCSYGNYTYCIGNEKCGDCFGACTSGTGRCTPSNGTRRFKCSSVEGSWNWESIHPTLIAVVISVFILIIFFIAAL